MTNKTTLRFEQFDETDDNAVSYQGPISIYKTVDTISQLKNIPNEVGFPALPDNEDNQWDKTALPNVVVYVKNVTSFPDDQTNRGAYFRYQYLTDGWQEIMLGTHTHFNKEVLDKITSGDIGSWINLSGYSTTIMGTSGTILPAPDADIVGKYFLLKGDSIEDPRTLYIGESQIAGEITNYTWTSVVRSTNTLFVDKVNYLLYRATRTVTAGIVNMKWNNVPLTYGDELPFKPNIRDMFFEVTSKQLFIFSGSKAGERKMLTLEVTDPDNSDLTYSFDVAWADLPEHIPYIPENADTSSYIGLDSAKKPVWKNSFVPSQTFQIKRITIVGSNPGTNEWIPGNTLHVGNVDYNQNTDEVLVMVGVFFLYNRDIIYDSNLRVIEIQSNEGSFDIGETITIIIIRNGTAAVMDKLASDYVTKAEAISLLSGGSVNLKNYATKGDLQTRAHKDHHHAEYARYTHDHDFRYANFKHTHSDYLTRRKVLELIQETIQLNPNIINILEGISTALSNNELQGFITTLENQLVTNADIQALQDQLDAIPGIYYNESELTIFVNSYIQSYYGIRTDQITTEYLDSYGVPLNLTQLLKEIKDDIDGDISIVHSKNLILDSDILVKLPEGEYIGDWDTDEIVPQGMTLQLILEKILQRRIEPTYKRPEITLSFNITDYPEIGDDLNVVITPTYIENDGGSLSSYRLEAQLGITSSLLINSNQLQVYDNIIQFQDIPLTISAYATHVSGPIKYDNLGNAYPDNRIQSGTTDTFAKVFTPVRALFYGGISNIGSIDSDLVRSFNKMTAENYNSFTIEYELPIGSQMILIAIPTYVGGLNRIDYREQFFADILPLFDHATVIVEAVNGSAGIPYDVYYYELPFPTNTKMNLTFIK